MSFIVDAVSSRLHRLKCAVVTAARLMAQEVAAIGGGFRVVPWMVTLTYRPGAEWEPGQITRAVKSAREHFRRRGVQWRCIWVAEMQERGAVHYHVLVWLPKGRSMPKWDKQGWWSWGLTRTERVKNAVGYAAKYVSKGGGVGFPAGLRTYGVSGLGCSSRAIAAWWKLPGWVRDSFGMHEVRRVSGAVLWLGRRLISPYTVVVQKLFGVSLVTVVRRAAGYAVARGPSSALIDKVIPATGEIRRTSSDVGKWSVCDEWEYRIAEAGWKLREWSGRVGFAERVFFWESVGASE